MKKKGVFVTIFFGAILLSSTIAIAIPGMDPEMETPNITMTGTPADNFPDEQRTTFCSSGGDAKSTDYVKEYLIPTECSNPLSVVSDYDGNVWFTQTNTGNLGMFNPVTEKFTEYDNPTWPEGGRSMMWGIDYAPDGSVWFTDETYDSVWKFSTVTEQYERLSYPSTDDNSLPQKLLIDGSQIIINDFTGNKLSILDVNLSDTEVNYLSIPSPLDDSVTADFALDENDNIWYTNWLYQQGGILIKFNQNDYRDDVLNSGEQFLPLVDYIDGYSLPIQLLTPNGVTFSDDGRLWIADTTSSSFFSFDPSSEEFIQYVTAEPMFETYGNQTGVVKSPISRPYWIENNDQGQLVFNEQTANNISVMDPKTQSLVEYHVPSKNPNWADCEDKSKSNCGVAQIFGFDVIDDKIWFTEWAENKIGVVDTGKSLPFTVNTNVESITIKKGETETISLSINPSSSNIGDINFNFAHTASTATKSSDLLISHDFNSSNEIIVSITASQIALSGDYKLLLGVFNSEVNVSKYVDVIIEP